MQWFQSHSDTTSTPKIITSLNFGAKAIAKLIEQHSQLMRGEGSFIHPPPHSAIEIVMITVQLTLNSCLWTYISRFCLLNQIKILFLGKYLDPINEERLCSNKRRSRSNRNPVSILESHCYSLEVHSYNL